MSRYHEGIYAPVTDELTAYDLEVEGALPPELRGLYLRNGPNPGTPPEPGQHWFAGDGMIHGVAIADGKALWYRNRFVRTALLARTGRPAAPGAERTPSPSNTTASAHFIGGIPIGATAAEGAVDPYQRAFGQPGLHVMDGGVMPANPGVNPSLLITSLAERAMAFWPHKGESDPRPPLGSGYRRLAPVLPRTPVVPAGAPGALRLDAKKDDVIPEYPY